MKDVRDLARQQVDVAIKTLVDIARDGKQEAARVSAATALLDRGYGRPTQPIAGDDEMAPIGVAVVTAEEIERRQARARALLDETFSQ